MLAEIWDTAVVQWLFNSVGSLSGWWLEAAVVAWLAWYNRGKLASVTKLWPASTPAGYSADGLAADLTYLRTLRATLDAANKLEASAAITKTIMPALLAIYSEPAPDPAPTPEAAV